uniref:Secreted protein n=1 Tax=Steinernema glaseri TaxID=37863 RepID=A0A1I7YSA2_9BILA
MVAAYSACITSFESLMFRLEASTIISGHRCETDVMFWRASFNQRQLPSSRTLSPLISPIIPAVSRFMLGTFRAICAVYERYCR